MSCIAIPNHSVHMCLVRLSCHLRDTPAQKGGIATLSASTQRTLSACDSPLLEPPSADSRSTITAAHASAQQIAAHGNDGRGHAHVPRRAARQASHPWRPELGTVERVFCRYSDHHWQACWPWIEHGPTQ